MTGWWLSELGAWVHLGCGAEGRYEVRDSLHYVACRPCDQRRRVPAPRPAFAHFTYGRTN